MTTDDLLEWIKILEPEVKALIETSHEARMVDISLRAFRKGLHIARPNLEKAIEAFVNRPCTRAAKGDE